MRKNSITGALNSCIISLRMKRNNLLLTLGLLRPPQADSSQRYCKQPHISGFTLLELLIATSIAGIITSVAAPNAFNILSSFQRNSQHMAILTDSQNLGFWLSHDVPMASSTNLTNNGPSSSTLSMTWLETYNGASIAHVAIYSLVNNQALRNYDGNYLTLSWNTASISFSMVASAIYVTSNSKPYYGHAAGQRRDYVLYPRP